MPPAAGELTTELWANLFRKGRKGDPKSREIRGRRHKARGK
jgi:hypothetical protein